MVSVYPCELHGQRIRGALEGIRITVLRDPNRFSRKLRVCPTDLDEMLRSHVDEWEFVSDEGLLDPASLQCSHCHDVPTGTRLAPAFVYVWRRGQPQVEYYAQYCRSCSDAAIAEYGLVEEPPSAGRV